MFHTEWQIRNWSLLKLRFVLTCLVIVGMSSFISLSASAQFADSPCDPKYYESLEARAWLEAQREITQNQNLIFKPDSVLEYTCFDKHLGLLAQQGQNMFSETQRWGQILSTTSLDGALTRLVASAVGQYQSANFSHNALGGRSSSPLSLSATASPGGYSCDVMNRIWQEAKCMGFIDNATHDGFFTFEQYKDDSDKRFLPSACPKSPTAAQWETNIRTAYEQPNWQADDVNTFLDKLFPQNGCGTGDASKVKTGLQVTRGKGTPREYEEYVCVAPGCYYDPSSSQCTQ